VRAAIANPANQQALYLPAAAVDVAPRLPIALQQAQDQLGQKAALQTDASLPRGSYAIRPIQ
jgi:hypothetical protein